MRIIRDESRFAHGIAVLILMLVGFHYPGVAYSQLEGELMAASTGASLAFGTAPPALNAPYLAQMAVALLVVIVAILALGWFVRRTVAGSNSLGHELKILGGLAVGARDRILLVQVGEQQILVGVGPGYMRTLHVLPLPIHGTGQAKHTNDSQFLRQLRTFLTPGSRNGS